MADIMQESNQNRIIDLQAGAHVMVLEAGLFCIFHASGQAAPGPSGLPGVRVSRAPGVLPAAVEISTFDCEGWIGGADGAALIRVNHGPAGVLVTTYRELNSHGNGPRLQVMRLASLGRGGSPDQGTGPVAGLGQGQSQQNHGESGIDLHTDRERGSSVEGHEAATSVEGVSVSQDVQAHIQRQGDCSVAVGQWIGQPGSQAWIEGFAINPVHDIIAEDIEYQAVLGKGWLSPWVEGGHFCGSRGMSLPVLGLRVRLKGMAAEKYRLSLSASFTDGTCLGPFEEMDDALEAESLAPLEAFCVAIEPRETESAPVISEAGETDLDVGKESVRKPRKRPRGHK